MPNVPLEIVGFLACVAFLVALANQGVSLVQKLRGKPLDISQPVDVQMVKECVRKDECQEKMTAIKERIDKLDGMELRMRDFYLQESKEIFKRVNDCAKSISEVVGEIRSWRATE